MDNRSHCKDYLVHFSEFIDGELSEELCSQLEEHLKGCENCTIIYNSLEKTIELYKHSGDEVPIPAEVHSRLLASLSLPDRPSVDHGRKE
jgi:RNA polymerase sigma-70 factor, ECF subfamily